MAIVIATTTSPSLIVQVMGNNDLLQRGKQTTIG
jgi:hypothetical protein